MLLRHSEEKSTTSTKEDEHLLTKTDEDMPGSPIYDPKNKNTFNISFDDGAMFDDSKLINHFFNSLFFRN
jgi:hypothetical protein